MYFQSQKYFKKQKSMIADFWGSSVFLLELVCQIMHIVGAE